MSTGAGVVKSQITFSSLTSPAASEGQPCARQSLGVVAARSNHVTSRACRGAGGDRPRRQGCLRQGLHHETATKLYGIVVRILGRRDLRRISCRRSIFAYGSMLASSILRPVRPSLGWERSRNRALDERKRKTMRSLDDFPEVLGLVSARLPSRRRRVE